RSCTEIAKRVVQAVERFGENWTWRSEIETKPGLTARPELRTRARKDPGSAANARRNIVSLKSGSRKVHPGKIRGVEPHRPRTGRRGLNSRIEQITIALEIWQQLIQPAVAGSPRRFRRDHAEGIIGAEPARRDTGINPALQRDV